RRRSHAPGRADGGSQRVQAAPGRARGARVAQGVRQGSSPPDHQSLARLVVEPDAVSGSVPLTWETARPLVPELALIAATIAYGTTFKLVQDALGDVTPVGFILLRFAMGAAVLLPFALRNGWRGPSTARADLRRRDFALAVLV